MRDAIRNWLPITKRNRVALGFAVAALVLFVAWNFLPNYSGGRNTYEGIVLTHLWPRFVEPDHYLRVIRSPNMNSFLEIAAVMSLLLNGAIVLAVVPFWRIIHASNFLTAPVAVANFAGGGVILWYLKGRLSLPLHVSPPYVLAMFALMAFSMFALGTAMLIFKNELGLRDDLEVKKTMAGGDDR